MNLLSRLLPLGMLASLPAWGQPPTVTVTLNGAGLVKVPATFVGFSYETSALTEASTSGFLPANTSFQQLFGLLGPGVIRFGGNSVDQIVAYAAGSRPANSCPTTIYSGDIDPLFTQFLENSNLSGWKVLWGLSLNPDFPLGEAQAEAGYVNSLSYAPYLAGFEIGNEPNLFVDDGYYTSFDEADYVSTWYTYATAIGAAGASHQTIPTALMTAAAATQGGLTSWTENVATSISPGTIKSYFGTLTQHLYAVMQPTGCPINDITTLLSSASRTSTSMPWIQAPVINGLQSWAPDIAAPHAWRITETGSFGSGGEANASNSFGTALWALDYMYQAMTHGAAGVNFHCGAGGGFNDTPIDVTVGNMAPIIVKPVYYGILAFHQGAQAGWTNQKVSTSAAGVNLTAYATADGSGNLHVTVINMDQVNAANVTITLTDADYPALQSGDMTYLSLLPGDGNGVASTSTAVTLGGQSVDVQETGGGSSWTPTIPASVQISGGTFTAPVAAASAVIFTITPP